MTRFQHFKAVAFESIPYVWDNTVGDENRLQRLFLIQCYEIRLSWRVLRDNECLFPKEVLMKLVAISSSALLYIYARAEGPSGSMHHSFYVPEPGRQRQEE